MSNFFKIEIQALSKEESNILIADLSEINFYAFEEEENGLIAYIKEEDFNEEKLKTVLKNELTFTKTLIKEENWNEQWESGFEPVIIRDFAAIRAMFHKPVKNVKYDLIITPKMSFGTGHHATTFLMIGLMGKISFKNKTVIDFGTGTGVLAILAEKLGASKVIAIDYDEWSINNAMENIEANNCHHIFLEKRDDLTDISAADILMANINLNVLTKVSSSINAFLKPGSLLLTSGFLIKDQSAMEKVFNENNFTTLFVIRKDGWMAILFEKL